MSSFVPFKKSEIDQAIPEIFEKQVSEYSDRLAIRTGATQLTYETLNKTSNRVARAVLKQDGAGEQPAALLFEQGAPLITALVGVLKSGRICVPLDPSFPREKLGAVLKDSRPRLIVTASKQLSLARELVQNGACILNVEEIDSDLSDENIGLRLSSDAVACILYTSGSTGQPKGVVYTHGTVLYNAMHFTNDLRVRADDRVALFYSSNVVGTMRNAFGALLSGATLLPLNLREFGVAGLAEWLMREEITIFTAVPTVFRHFVQTLTREHQFPKLRLVRLGSDTVRKSDVDLYKEHFSSNCLLLIALACTEAGIICRYFIDKNTEIAGDLVPVGYAVEGTEIALLDDAGQEVRIGEIGEITVKSRYLPLGYWQKPELTQGAFLTDRQTGTQRIYHTGDLGRMLPDGSLVHLGRKDFRAKIRGYRIEVGEVETALLMHPDIKEAVVAERDNGLHEKRLVAYVVFRHEPAVSASELRHFLRNKLPEYMVPSSFMPLRALPLTPNGKIDRQALPAPDEASLDPRGPFVAPRTPVEKSLLGIWAEVLRVLDRIGVDDNFFDLGGHSLLATQVISRVRDAFGIELLMRDLVEAPTVATLAKRVEDARRAGGRLLQAHPLRRVSRERPLPLSLAQERLWFLNQLEPESADQNLIYSVRLSGLLDAVALEKSLNEVIRRHEVLRTRFVIEEGKPVQVICANQVSALPVLDLSQVPQYQRESRSQELAALEAQRPFDLAQGPVIRSKLLRLDREDHVLLLVIHHIAFDLWSLSVLVRDLSVLYTAACAGGRFPLPELSVQYADFAVWQREWLQGEVLQTQLAYWRRQLAGASVLKLSTDRPRPSVQTFRGATQSFVVSSELTAALKVLSRLEGATLFMGLLAAFTALLHSYSGQDDISVGTFIINRNRAETENLIGFFINNLVLRSDLSGNPTFRELLGRARAVALAALAHPDVPFEKLLEELRPQRDRSRTPLFQVMLVLQNAPSWRLELPGIGATPYPVARSARSNFDLTLWMWEEAQGLSGTLEYNADLFEDDSIAAMIADFQLVLKKIVADPDQRLSALSPPPSSTRHRRPVEADDPARANDGAAGGSSEGPASSAPASAIDTAREEAQLSNRRSQLSATKRALLEKRLRGESTEHLGQKSAQRR